MDVSEDR
jgi:hypothetical protein